MNVIKTDLLDVYIIEPKVFGDNRGWFMESYSKATFEKEGFFYNFIQDNHSYSAEKGTLRGLHCQVGEASQAKLVHCTRGAVLDVVVDIRKGSPTYKQWIGVELSADNHRQILVPRGFLHGFLTLTENTEFVYKVDNYYNKEADRSVLWNDTEFGILWGVDNPILSDKDLEAPLYQESDINFVYE